MRVSISTPSRLHFGLLRFEERDGASYGGLGMMIDQPRWNVKLEAADGWSASGAGGERAIEFARRALSRVKGAAQPQAVRVEISADVPQHCGLGGGTQLALAVAAGVRRLAQLPAGTAAELAAMAGRGERSAVGSHGFVQGGLIWETGRPPGQPLGELACRVAVPQDWRVVLSMPPGERGLSGRVEIEAFRQLPSAPGAITRRLVELAERDIVPAAKRADADHFGEAVYEYGRLAGECFAPIQGGPYASPQIADCVAAIRGLGARGVGQSSWGPTVFAVADSQARGAQLIEQLRRDRRFAHYDVTMVRPDNRGAMMSGGT